MTVEIYTALIVTLIYIINIGHLYVVSRGPVVKIEFREDDEIRVKESLCTK